MKVCKIVDKSLQTFFWKQADYNDLIWASENMSGSDGMHARFRYLDYCCANRKEYLGELDLAFSSYRELRLGYGDNLVILAKLDCANIILAFANYIDIDEPQSGGWTLLTHASGWDSHATVKVLIKEGANVNYDEGTDTVSALEFVMTHDTVDVAKFLIENGANVNAIKKRGDNERSPLMTACVFQNYELANLLIKSRASVNFMSTFSGTALTIAAGGSNENIVRLLIDNGANINLGLQSGHSVLINACEQSHSLSFIKYLISKGAEINTPSACSVTPLINACIKGDKSIVLYLIGSGAIVDQPCRSGITPLMYAVQNNNNSVASLLIDRGADPLLKDGEGRNIFMHGAIGGNEDLARWINQKGICKNDKDLSGLTALMHASRQGHLNVVKFLLQEKANFDAKDYSGMNALMHLSVNHLFHIVLHLNRDLEEDDYTHDDIQQLKPHGIPSDQLEDLLITNTSNLDDLNLEGKSALMLAEEKGHDRFVEVLINSGARRLPKMNLFFDYNKTGH